MPTVPSSKTRVMVDATAQLHEQLKVLLSGTFLRQVMGWTSKELEEIRHRKWSDLEENTQASGQRSKTLPEHGS
jgi:hypothetical protein